MRCATRLSVWLAVCLTAGVVRSSAQTPPPQTPPPTTPAQTAPTAPAPKPRQAAAPPAGRLTLALMVTALDGKTVPDAKVKASGPVDREGLTDPSGQLSFVNMPAGTYRLRFEHKEFVTFEKEVTLAAGRPLRISAALTAAPPPPPAPKPEPPPAPPIPPPDANYSPSTTTIVDFVEKNYIGSAAVKRAPLACGASSSSTLIQTKDPVDNHAHDADEIVYVVAGEGMLKIDGRDTPLVATTLAFIPKGMAHTFTRRGSRPLIFISTLAGPPCQPGK
jgi:mannose-6-phosphate isomerase-like protein (cupin superfamily)